MKKKVIIIAAAFLCAVGAVLFAVSHKTDLGYNDWFVIGSTEKEITDRYGSFDKEYGKTKGYYIGDDDSAVMPSHQPMYYWITFDDSGKAKSVEKQTAPGG